MRNGVKLTGATKFNRGLERMVKDLDRETASVLKQEARAVCVSLGMRTRWPGTRDKSAEQGEKVRGDIGAIYVSPSNSTGVYEMVQARRPELAGAYWAASKSGKTARAKKIAAQAGIVVEELDRRHHRRSWGGGHARGDAPEQLVREMALRKYITEKLKTVGVAKAGWYAAARALGGRVRSNSVADDGKRSTAEIFPAYVRKAARRFPGLGGARIGKRTVEVFTNVKHAEEAIPYRAYLSAINAGQRSFSAAMKKSLDLLATKHFRRP